MVMYVAGKAHERKKTKRGECKMRQVAVTVSCVASFEVSVPDSVEEVLAELSSDTILRLVQEGILRRERQELRHSMMDAIYAMKRNR